MVPHLYILRLADKGLLDTDPLTLVRNTTREVLHVRVPPSKAYQLQSYLLITQWSTPQMKPQCLRVGPGPTPRLFDCAVDVVQFGQKPVLEVVWTPLWTPQSAE